MSKSRTSKSSTKTPVRPTTSIAPLLIIFIAIVVIVGVLLTTNKHQTDITSQYAKINIPSSFALKSRQPFTQSSKQLEVYTYQTSDSVSTIYAELTQALRNANYVTTNSSGNLSAQNGKEQLGVKVSKTKATDAYFKVTVTVEEMN